eukprot:g38813.t1
MERITFPPQLLTNGPSHGRCDRCCCCRAAKGRGDKKEGICQLVLDQQQHVTEAEQAASCEKITAGGPSVKKQQFMSSEIKLHGPIGTSPK